MPLVGLGALLRLAGEGRRRSAIGMAMAGFGLLSVLLMWPLATPLTRWLQQRLRAREDDEAQPRHLDDNVLAVARDLAVAASLRCGHRSLRRTPAERAVPPSERELD